MEEAHKRNAARERGECQKSKWRVSKLRLKRF